MTTAPRWRRRVLLALAALLGLAALAWAFAPRPLEVELARATRGPFEQTIDEDGRTRLRDRYVVSAPLAGRLARIGLREGDALAQGAVVAQLTPAASPLLDERSRLGQQAQVEVAQAALQGARSRVARARVAEQQAQADLRRSEELARQGFVAPARLDAERLALRAASQEVQVARDDEQVALHQLAQARAALLPAGSAAALAGGRAAATAGSVEGRTSGAGRVDVPAPVAGRTDGAAHVAGRVDVMAPGAGRVDVLAPVAGRVLRVLQPSEAMVAAGTPLVEIGDVAGLEVVVDMLTTDALRLAPGALARIERWGGPGDLQARLRLVEPAAFTKVSALGVEEQRVRVLFDITSPRERWSALGDGYRVSVRALLISERDVLRVPVSAVFPVPAAPAGAASAPAPDAAHSAVFIVDADGRARQRPVQLAARNGIDAWLRGGIEAGTPVVLYPPSALADGMRVKTRVD